MVFKNLILRILVGILVIMFVLFGLNKLLSINIDYKELIITAILIVLFGHIVFKVFKPYTFK